VALSSLHHVIDIEWMKEASDGCGRSYCALAGEPEMLQTQSVVEPVLVEKPSVFRRDVAGAWRLSICATSGRGSLLEQRNPVFQPTLF